MKQQLAKGITRDAIQKTLESAGGWGFADIDSAFAMIAAIPSPSVPEAPANISSTTVPAQNTGASPAAEPSM